LRSETSWNKNLSACAGSDTGKGRLEDGRNRAVVVSLRRCYSVSSLHLEHDVDLISMDNDPLDRFANEGAGFGAPDTRAGGQIIPGQPAIQDLDHKPLYIICTDTCA